MRLRHDGHRQSYLGRGENAEILKGEKLRLHHGLQTTGPRGGGRDGIEIMANEPICRAASSSRIASSVFQ